eukprot:snap_masked-scaffold_1-processed-gene-17.25-mRNA-1 protein AED:1.00 eAED:1.00 QI:0/0/0/0/1/1/2/0/383
MNVRRVFLGFLTVIVLATLFVNLQLIHRKEKLEEEEQNLVRETCASCKFMSSNGECAGDFSQDMSFVGRTSVKNMVRLVSVDNLEKETGKVDICRSDETVGVSPRFSDFVHGISFCQEPRDFFDLSRYTFPSLIPQNGKPISSETMFIYYSQVLKNMLESKAKPCLKMFVNAILGEKTLKYNFEEKRPLAIVHVRQGDSCERISKEFGDVNFSKGRPCYNLNLFFQALSKQAKGKLVNVLLITDGERERVFLPFQEYCKNNNLGLLYLDTHKELFSSTTFIETRELSAEERFYILLSLFADLTLAASTLDWLKEGERVIFIGTSLSWISRLLFLLTASRYGTVPSFEFLDAPFVDRKFSSLIWWDSTLEDKCSVCACPSSQEG